MDNATIHQFVQDSPGLVAERRRARRRIVLENLIIYCAILAVSFGAWVGIIYVLGVIGGTW